MTSAADGSDEQLFGVNEQISVQGQSKQEAEKTYRFRGRRPKNNSRVPHKWSGTFIRGWQEGHESAVGLV